MKKDEQQRDKERVQFLGVRRAWVGIALFMFCILRARLLASRARLFLYRAIHVLYPYLGL